MEQNYQTTELPTSASSATSPGGVSWVNPGNVTADDGSDATLNYTLGGDSGADLTADNFGFSMPDSAVIDGVAITIEGTNVGVGGTIALGVSGADTVDIGTLNTVYGGSTDLWGLDEITAADLAGIDVLIATGDVSGGDGIATIDYISITVFWHVDTTVAVAEVPTRIDYKVYSRNGSFLGRLPDVTSKLVFPQDINSAGSSIVVTCGKFANNGVSVEPLLDDNDDELLDSNSNPILAAETDIVVAAGNSLHDAIFKNSNKVKIYVYNKYYPQGKLAFSGEIDRVNFKYGIHDSSVKLTLYSDGLDMGNFTARSFPFSHTNDVSQLVQDGYTTVTRDSKGSGWDFWGQTFLAGSVDNVSAITLKVKGTAQVTVSLYDGPNGNLLGVISKDVSEAAATDEQFEFTQPIVISADTEYFFTVSVASGQQIRLYRDEFDTSYSDGSRYRSLFGGAGGGDYLEVDGDLYFITKSAEGTTTAVYSSDDPVADMASGILEEYNNRGGNIKERDFDATGLSLSYTFVVASVLDAINKILELCPTGYYYAVDVGTAEIDFKEISSTAEYTAVLGRHIFELDLALTIEQVKNYLLLSGGDTGGGENLYRDYIDAESAANFGLRTAHRSDNRITLAATADALGDTFVSENGPEGQETRLTVLSEHMDISLLTPGKTVGFKNFGNFIDDMVLQIVRGEINHSDGVAVLVLGRLPVRMNDEVQRINRELTNQQTIDNPSAPS